jgi:type I restriction enzyme R subunit
VDEAQEDAIARASGGRKVLELCADLLGSIDTDENARRAAARFGLAEGQEPTERQVEQVEQERVGAALKPFFNPRLREAILGAKQALEQVIDEVSPDHLLRAGFDGAAREKARSMLSSFRQFLEEHKDEIEALKVLYSRPYRAGLRYGQVKELAAEIQRPPHQLHPERLWQAYETVEPEKVRGHGGAHLVDVIALVRHALEPGSLLTPFEETVEERYQRWLREQSGAGADFSAEQRRWLDAIKDHIARSLTIEEEDFADVPFNQFGGLGKAYELFGEQLPEILEELNMRLAA